MLADLGVREKLIAIRDLAKVSQGRLAQILGVSFVSISRWEHGASIPSPAQAQQIDNLYSSISTDPQAPLLIESERGIFSSRGVRRSISTLPLLNHQSSDMILSSDPLPPVFERLTQGHYFAPGSQPSIGMLLAEHIEPARTVLNPPSAGVSAGKNTYTYDAHTYHTKVPPQGIAEIVKHYLPTGGLVLDPFSGSGMTGVACRANGYDCILNELSPAACFISDRFTSRIAPDLFKSGYRRVLEELAELRKKLYTTHCRECGEATELLYVVWSFRVLCHHCDHEFQLWDHCRQYGNRVRDHKILKEFPCPNCGETVHKSRLKRTAAEPVQIGYKCCQSRQQEKTHAPDAFDLKLIDEIESGTFFAEGYYPTNPLPQGVNLRQPISHGLDRIDKFYTSRNLSALSNIWRTIHRVEDLELAAYLAFVFTSLYQRVTRLSEFRFWGGSGNTARFNVPYIFNESNVFLTFERKARTILDHLESTATHYSGSALVVQNSATNLAFLPNESIDLVFTDPPFGANINYSDMNFLWESWLGAFTEITDEAIVNRVQHKGIHEYRELMTKSLKECYRVLRQGSWMALVFMNSSKEVWSALRTAITDAGFSIRRIDTFDKQHGTFKQFVSDNTAGMDLVLHCQKGGATEYRQQRMVASSPQGRVQDFLREIDMSTRRSVYLHVKRADETDVRSLYSQWLSQALLHEQEPMDFAEFRRIVEDMVTASQLEDADEGE